MNEFFEEKGHTKSISVTPLSGWNVAHLSYSGNAKWDHGEWLNSRNVVINLQELWLLWKCYRLYPRGRGGGNKCINTLHANSCIKFCSRVLRSPSMDLHMGPQNSGWEPLVKGNRWIPLVQKRAKYFPALSFPQVVTMAVAEDAVMNTTHVLAAQWAHGNATAYEMLL